MNQCTNLASSPSLHISLIHSLPLLVRHLLREARPLCQHWSHWLALVEVVEPVVESLHGREVGLQCKVLPHCSSWQFSSFCPSPFFCRLL